MNVASHASAKCTISRDAKRGLTCGPRMSTTSQMSASTAVMYGTTTKACSTPVRPAPVPMAIPRAPPAAPGPA